MGLTSVGDALGKGAMTLTHAGIAQPRREAAAIWASLTGADLGQVWLSQHDAAPESLVSGYEAAIERRSSGEPLAYVVGTTGFRTIELTVDRRVLIPRPETEGLVERVLAWNTRRYGEEGNWGAVADVGTGSGCVALALAVEGKFERILAIDASAEALDLARQNWAAVAPGTPVQFCLGDGLGPVGEESLSVIVSNPPYVTLAEYDTLDRGVRDHEPRKALVSGRDGMDHIRALLTDAAPLLLSGGLLAIEIDSTRADLALRSAREAGWADARVEQDLFAHPRYLLATKEF